MAEPKMLWIDMETTGLDARLDVPLEIGLKITDEHGFPIAEQSWLIWEKNIDYKRSMERAMKLDIVREMHTASGLFTDLKDEHREKLTRYEAERQMLDFIGENGGVGLPLAGNSIGSLDRPFVLEHFPEFNKTVHYRNIDISTIKEICKLINPSLFENLRPIIGTKADAPHRVLGDINASILEYRAYIENFFFTED